MQDSQYFHHHQLYQQTIDWVSYNTDQANALGYHTTTSTGLPLGKVFAVDAQQAGVPWSITFSHEALEMLIDPFAITCVFAQYSTTTGILIAYEICDPCQNTSYSIGGTLVSDFILPAWFDYFQTNGPFDFASQMTTIRNITRRLCINLLRT